MEAGGGERGSDLGGSSSLVCAWEMRRDLENAAVAVGVLPRFLASLEDVLGLEFCLIGDEDGPSGANGTVVVFVTVLTGVISALGGASTDLSRLL